MTTVTLGLAQRMHAAYLTPLSMRAVGLRFGVSKTAVARAFREWKLPARPRGWNARIAKPRRPAQSIVRFTPPPPLKTFCGQCERCVTVAEAGICRSQFCKVTNCDERRVLSAVTRLVPDSVSQRRGA